MCAEIDTIFIQVTWNFFSRSKATNTEMKSHLINQTEVNVAASLHSVNIHSLVRIDKVILFF